MRTIDLIASLGALALCGCAGPRTSSPTGPLVAAPPAQAAIQPGTNVSAAIAGTWHFREKTILLELAQDGRWKWWDLNEQSGRPSEAPLLGGRWFVREGVLFLRIEDVKERTGHINPDLAFTFDVRSVTPEAMVLYEIGEKVEMKFRRIAEPDGPANGSQPIRSETNRTPSAAGSRR